MLAKAAPLVLIVLAACAQTPRAESDAARGAADGPGEASTPLSAPEGLAYFVGTWHADAEDPRTGDRFTLLYRVEPALGGAWLSGAGASEELGLEIHDMWGRDPQSGEIVRTIFQSNGMSGTVRSAGWESDTLRLAGEVRTPGGALPVRETITRVGPAEFRAVWEMLVDGEWVPYSVERLTKRRE